MNVTVSHHNELHICGESGFVLPAVVASPALPSSSHTMQLRRLDAASQYFTKAWRKRL
jgi:hypothetical protein